MKRSFEGAPAAGKAPRVDPVSGQIDFSNGVPAANLMPKLTDQHKLQQRQKQIDFGKNTIAYMRYSSEVRRRDRLPSDPWTPDIAEPYSKRCFDGKVKDWRRKLHLWENQHPAEVPGSTTSDATRTDSGECSSASAPSTAVVPTVVAGITAGADDFDDFLDDFLEEDEEPLAQLQPQPPQQQNSNPQQSGHGSVPAVQGSALGGSSTAGAAKPTTEASAPLSWTSATVASAAIGGMATASASSEGSHGGANGASSEPSSLRARLNAFKNPTASKAGPGSGSQSAGIFGTFDDGLV